MAQLRQLGCDAFIEIGPQPVLVKFLGLKVMVGGRQLWGSAVLMTFIKEYGCFQK